MRKRKVRRFYICTNCGHIKITPLENEQSGQEYWNSKCSHCYSQMESSGVKDYSIERYLNELKNGELDEVTSIRILKSRVMTKKERADEIMEKLKQVRGIDAIILPNGCEIAGIMTGEDDGP